MSGNARPKKELRIILRFSFHLLKSFRPYSFKIMISHRRWLQ